MKIKQQLVGISFGLWVLAGSAFAQDIRVFTKIYAGDATEPFVRSLTMFHAGKIYDYIEPAQEVTIFEPALRRFTVLSKTRQLRSEVTQEEIRHFLGLAQDEAIKLLRGPNRKLTPKAIALLQFQLYPEFTTTFDSAKSLLTLSGSGFQYVATTSAPETPEIAEKYLHVADWTAQFNAVLHPKSMLPAPRMLLNQELRQRGLIPKTVELKAEGDAEIHLVAQHEWWWNLKETDRQMIDGWEKELQNPAFRPLSFVKFQQEMLKIDFPRKTASR